MNALRWTWRLLLAIGAGVVAILTLKAWREREDRASGAREEKQWAEDAKAEAFRADMDALKQRQNARLAAAIAREALEDRLRAEADAQIAPPEPASQTTEDIIEQARRAQKEREQ